jgi:hypothetical protein
MGLRLRRAAPSIPTRADALNSSTAAKGRRAAARPMQIIVFPVKQTAPTHPPPLLFNPQHHKGGKGAIIFKQTPKGPSEAALKTAGVSAHRISSSHGAQKEGDEAA